RSLWLANVRRMFPGFDESSIHDFVVNRTRYVEPLHGLGETEKILPIETEIPGLFLATTAQIYPDLTNGESVTRHALRAAEQVQAFMARTESGQTARSVGFNLPRRPRFPSFRLASTAITAGNTVARFRQGELSMQANAK